MLTGCPFCHHSDNSFYREKQELHGGGTRDIYKCNECGLLYPEVRLGTSEVTEYLLKMYTNQTEYEYLDPKRDYDRNMPMARLVEGIMFKNKSLDIGTFDGRLTYVFEDMGFESYGLESQKRAVEFTQSHGLKVFEGSFPNDIPEDLAQQKYSLITMSEMIYYLNDLKEALLKVCSMLESNGFFIIKAHQGNSRYYMYNSYFKRYRDHVQGIPTVESLNHCLKEAGFKPVRYHGYTDNELYNELNYTDAEIGTADVIYIVCQKEVSYQYANP
jgi:hypothetical protein